MRGQEEFERLATATASYIEVMGGVALTIGGISVEKSGSLKNKFTLRIDFIGRPPTKKV